MSQQERFISSTMYLAERLGIKSRRWPRCLTDGPKLVQHQFPQFCFQSRSQTQRSYENLKWHFHIYSTMKYNSLGAVAMALFVVNAFAAPAPIESRDVPLLGGHSGILEGLGESLDSIEKFVPGLGQ